MQDMSELAFKWCDYFLPEEVLRKKSPQKSNKTGSRYEPTLQQVSGGTNRQKSSN